MPTQEVAGGILAQEECACFQDKYGLHNSGGRSRMLPEQRRCDAGAASPPKSLSGQVL